MIIFVAEFTNNIVRWKKLNWFTTEVESFWKTRC